MRPSNILSSHQNSASHKSIYLNKDLNNVELELTLLEKSHTNFGAVTDTAKDLLQKTTRTNAAMMAGR